jgi:hypothetical protein
MMAESSSSINPPAKIMPLKASGRQKRVISLARKIDGVMRAHPDRYEAIDAHDMARVLFRLASDEEDFSGRSFFSVSTSF